MIKCLTVMQPWASLIVHGFKSYETRSWITTHRGPLLIHASRRFDAASRDLATQQPFASCLASAHYRGCLSYDSCPFSCEREHAISAKCQSVTDSAKSFSLVGDRQKHRKKWEKILQLTSLAITTPW